MPQAATARGPLVWRDLDQKALDDAYDQDVYAPNRPLILLFPTRVMVTTPGDFQAMGRNVLAQFAKALGVAGAAVAAAVAGVVVYLLTGRNLWAATAAAWAAAALFAVTLVPVMGWAFQVYDVARDAPP